MGRKKTLPHRRLKKKPKAQPTAAVSTAVAEPSPAAESAPTRRAVAPPGPKPAVVIDFKDIEAYVRRELVRIAVVAAAVFGLILILGSLIN